MTFTEDFTVRGGFLTFIYFIYFYTFQTSEQGWQYGMVRSEFAYYVPRTLSRTVPSYRTSVQFLKRTVPVPLQKRRQVPAYRTSYQKLRRTVPYLRTVLYCHPCF